MQITRLNNTKNKVIQSQKVENKNVYVSDEDFFSVSNSLLFKNLRAYKELAK